MGILQRSAKLLLCLRCCGRLREDGDLLCRREPLPGSKKDKQREMVEDAVMMCVDLYSLTHPGSIVILLPPVGLTHVAIHEVRAPVDELILLLLQRVWQLALVLFVNFPSRYSTARKSASALCSARLRCRIR